MLLLRISKSNLTSSLCGVYLILWFKLLLSSNSPFRVNLRLATFALLGPEAAAGDFMALLGPGRRPGDCSEIQGIPPFPPALFLFSDWFGASLKPGYLYTGVPI